MRTEKLTLVLRSSIALASASKKFQKKKKIQYTSKSEVKSTRFFFLTFLYCFLVVGRKRLLHLDCTVSTFFDEFLVLNASRGK